MEKNTVVCKQHYLPSKGEGNNIHQQIPSLDRCATLQSLVAVVVHKLH